MYRVLADEITGLCNRKYKKGATVTPNMLPGRNAQVLHERGHLELIHKVPAKNETHKYKDITADELKSILGLPKTDKTPKKDLYQRYLGR